ncbi:MAG: acyl-CoA dehydrogenase family protein [Acidimicrobiales bacterium]
MTVTFVLSEEQEELRHVVRSFLAEVSPPQRVRELMESDPGYDPAVWRRMATELGLHGLALPEDVGGSGFGWVELGLVFEEMGRVLLCAPFLSTVALAAGALQAAGDGDDLLAGIASGGTVATLAVTEDNGSWRADGVALAARPGAGGWVLDGHKAYVVDGLAAGLVLVAARSPSGVGLFAVDGAAPGLRREPMAAMDLTRPLARLEFASTPARLIGPDGGGWPAVETAHALGVVALAAEQVGGAQRALELSIEYALSRRQFGRPIGSFQAIKHRLADLLTEVEAARSTAAYAAFAASRDDRDELLIAAALAHAACSEAYVHVAGECIQVHGALGFTWEHDAHLYFKRAKASSLLFGDPALHRALLADRLGI